MKKTIKAQFAVALSLGLALATTAQEVKETIQPLSPKAVKGYMFNATKDKVGNSTITYKIPGAKKTNEIFFEEYNFDNALKFTGSKEVPEKKEQHDDFEETSYGAYVGGVTSADPIRLFFATKLQMKMW